MKSALVVVINGLLPGSPSEPGQPASAGHRPGGPLHLAGCTASEGDRDESEPGLGALERFVGTGVSGGHPSHKDQTQIARGLLKAVPGFGQLQG